MKVIHRNSHEIYIAKDVSAVNVKKWQESSNTKIPEAGCQRLA